MKKILLILFALCSIAAMAQEREYRPFCEEGKTWHTDYYNLLSGDWSSAVTCLKGDTLIAGRSCKKCYTGDQYGWFFLNMFYSEKKIPVSRANKTAIKETLSIMQC